MKQTTKDWFSIAEDDLLAAKTLANEARLTNLVSFHCQQCLEKCFNTKLHSKRNYSEFECLLGIMPMLFKNNFKNSSALKLYFERKSV